MTMGYVAFDLGASSGKLFSGRIAEGKLALQEEYTFPNDIVCLGEGMYWNLMGIYSGLVRGLQRAEEREPVVSLGIDSFNNDFSLIDKAGELLYPLRSYRDPRTRRYWREIFSRMSPRELYMYSGNQIAPFNTLMQLAAMRLGGQGYLLDNAHRLLMLPDLLGYYITGEEGIEYTLAAETQMLDLVTREWIEPVLSCYEVPRSLLPVLREPGTILGRSTGDFNARHGLKGFDFVNVCEHDTASAFLASPIGRDALYISSGTWALVGLETEAPVVNDFTYEKNIANEGGWPGCHRLLRNVMGYWLLQELRRDFALQGRQYTFPEMAALAEQAPAFRFPLDPDAEAFYLPGGMGEKIRAQCRKNLGRAPQSDGELLRAVYEGLAMKYRYCFSLLEQAVGRKYHVVNIFGGGCRDSLCNQFVADACNRQVVAGPVNASAIGNILVQAVARGQLASIEEGRALVAASFPLQSYYPRDHGFWDSRYADYLRLFGG